MKENDDYATVGELKLQDEALYAWIDRLAAENTQLRAAIARLEDRVREIENTVLP